MKTLLIAWHSRTGAARQMAQALERGALAAALALEQPGQLRVRRQAASRTDAAALLAADGYLFCAPENLGSLSGAMKECFDRC